jgi:3-deoxy-D-manno-octulosonate 8-phosphate phosphatase (KDO 8-P phosphatase)
LLLDSDEIRAYYSKGNDVWRDLMDLSKIKIIVSEMDGILNDGTVAFGEMAIPMFKSFSTKDLEAINEIKRHWPFVFMSADAAINMSFCRKKNTPFFVAERNKKETFKRILNKYSVTADEVLYLGSSYSDLECMKMAGISFCPEDSVAQAINLADKVLPIFAGEGVIASAYDLLYADLLYRQRQE